MALNISEKADVVQSQKKPHGEVGLRTAILESYDELCGLSEEWSALWSSDPGRQVFQRFGWVRAWLAAYGKEHELYCPVVYQGSRCMGILPLVRAGRTLRFIGYSAADYNNLICSPADAATVLRAALEHLFHAAGRWDRLVLESVLEDSVLADAIQQLPMSMQARLSITAATDCPLLRLEQAKTETLGSILGKEKTRKTLRYFARLGEVSFRHFADPEEAKAHLQEFFRQHIRRWAFEDLRSLFLDQRRIQFYEALLSEPDLQNEVRFSVLCLNGRAAAYHLGFEVDGRFLFYKPTFDVNLWEHSPGQVLLFHLLQYAESAPIREFDFGVGPEIYKYRFNNVTRRVLTFEAVLPGIRSSLRSYGSACGMALKARIGKVGWLRAVAVGVIREADKVAARRRQAGAGTAIREVCTALGRRIVSHRVLLLFRLHGTGSAPAHPGSTALVRDVTLADLADTAIGSVALDGKALHGARVRMKAGERLFGSFVNDALEYAVWAQRTSEAEFENVPIHFGHEVLLLTESPYGQPNPSCESRMALLQQIVLEESAKGQEVWLAAAPGHLSVPRPEHGLTGEAVYRMSRTRIFGRFRKGRLRRLTVNCAETSGPLSPRTWLERKK